jgi:hypothetical protein
MQYIILLTCAIVQHGVLLVNLVNTVLSDQVSQSLRLQIIGLSIQTGASLTNN